MSWLVWAALLHAEPAVTGQVASYEVVSDTAIDVVITVQRSDPSRARHLPAARPVHRLPAGGRAATSRSRPSTAKVVDKPVTLTTLRRATSVTVRSCTSG